MKKFILQIGIFLLFAAAFYFVALNIWGVYAPKFMAGNVKQKIGVHGFTAKRIHDVGEVSNVDILFIGSSHCYRGYDPRIFQRENFSSFNLGSNSQTPIQSEILLKRHLKNLSPDLVILDVYPVVMQNDGIESTIDFLGNTTIQKDLAAIALQSKNAVVLNTLLFRYTRQNLGLDTLPIHRTTKGSDTYVEYGFVQNNAVFKNTATYSTKKIEFSDDQVDAFENMIQFLNDEKINYIIVQSPLARARYQSYSNNREMDSTFASYGRYYNFNEMATVPDSLFIDDSHLNQNGVEFFNNKLIERLKMDGILWDKEKTEATKSLSSLSTF
ncbi:MAG: hypothetical protein ACKVOK_15015 [Flavobacteriales bacterium]